jgi:hypothetical protein
MFEAGEDSRVIAAHASRVKTKYQAGAISRACMLGQQHYMRLQALGCGTKAKPGRQGNTQGILCAQAAHIQHDATEATSLEQKISNTQTLFQPRPGLASGCRSQARRRERCELCIWLLGFWPWFV